MTHPTPDLKSKNTHRKRWRSPSERRPHTALSFSLLASIISTIAIGCTQPAVIDSSDLAADTANSVQSDTVKPDVQPADAPKHSDTGTITDSAVANADSQGTTTPVNNTPNTASPTTFEESVMSGVEKHIGYGQARAILIANGWTPGINNTENSERYRLDGTIRKLVDKGYKEVQDCSGSGLGYCRFDFAYTGQGYPNQNGRGLSITTVYSQTAANGDPTIWDWSISEPADSISIASASSATPASSNGQTIKAYADKPFSLETFDPHVKQSDGFCTGMSGDCVYSEYAFQNLTLTAAPGEIGGTTITLLPKGPITEETAKEYINILDTAHNISFSQTSSTWVNPDGNLVKRYEGCVQAGEMGLAASCYAHLTTTNMGSVSEIKYIRVVGGQ
ncbi:MAG: hypothetical protein ACFB0D_15005 [Phormidesmis sp.]